MLAIKKSDFEIYREILYTFYFREVYSMGKKVVTLPISGKITVSHSKKLEWALRDFITSTGTSYYDDEISNGRIAVYFKLDNEICVEQKVHIRQEDYICYTTLSCCVRDKEKIAECVKIANAINLELDYGNFEVDEQTGEVKFRTYYEPRDIIYMESLDKLLGYPRQIINKYGCKFLNLRK